MRYADGMGGYTYVIELAPKVELPRFIYLPKPTPSWKASPMQRAEQGRQAKLHPTRKRG